MNKERTILYLFSINAIIYIASGFYTPFLSAYYAQKGIDAEKIGILLMIGPCVVLLTQRFWAKISDRTGKRKEVLLVTIVGSGFSMLLYYLGNSFLCMFFATVVVTSFTTAVIPLSDALEGSTDLWEKRHLSNTMQNKALLGLYLPILPLSADSTRYPVSLYEAWSLLYPLPTEYLPEN